MSELSGVGIVMKSVQGQGEYINSSYQCQKGFHGIRASRQYTVLDKALQWLSCLKHQGPQPKKKKKSPNTPQKWLKQTSGQENREEINVLLMILKVGRDTNGNPNKQLKKM